MGDEGEEWGREKEKLKKGEGEEKLDSLEGGGGGFQCPLSVFLMPETFLQRLLYSSG